MATIQIKRRTSSGSGPLTGATGSVKAGEPLVDFNGGNLYIAKADKTATTANPLSTSDYLAIPGVEAVNKQIDTKVSALGLGTASKKNVGVLSGCVPVLDTNGKLSDSVIPKVAITNTFVVESQSAMLALSTAQEGDIAIRTDLNKSFILKTTGYSTLANWQELLTPTDKVQSVNGKTGTVTINLNDLGGVSSSTFTSHVDSNVHLTEQQRERLANVRDTSIYGNGGATYTGDPQTFADSVITNGLVLLATFNEDYNPPSVVYSYGINSEKVLTPTSIIDGGTY